MFGFLETPVDELLDASPDIATPPGAGARRASAAPVRVALDSLFWGIRLCVLSLPENIGLPSAPVGPEALPELLDSAPPLDDDPDPPPDDVPPPELEELEDEVVVVRGTA